MTTHATALAAQLLDAHVAFVTAELTAPEAADMIAGEVVGVLDALDETVLREVVSADAVWESVRAGLAAVGPSPGLAEAVPSVTATIGDLPDNATTTLGSVVDRTAVAALVEVLAGSTTLRGEVLRRASQSPAVSTLALRFVSALVGEAVQQNRERAEKVPGMKSLLGVGDFAARQARGMAPKQLEKAVGGAADRGTQAAMERVTRALTETFDEAAVRAAAMELWDLHAGTPIADAQSYLAQDEVDAVVRSGHDVWRGLHDTPWFHTAVRAGIDAFFERYGDVTIGGLLGDFGVERDVVAAAVARHVPLFVEALEAQGHLETLVRRRLAPFYDSAAAHAVLEGQG